MGWYGAYEWQSRGDVIRALNAPKGEYDEAHSKLVKAASVGSNLWQVRELVKTGERCIILHMIQGGKREGFTYKPVEETMGPYQYSCPLSYLDLAPQPLGPDGKPHEWSEKWRAGVREYHAAKAAKRALARGLKVGSKVRLVEGISAGGVKIGGEVVEVSSVKPLRVRSKVGVLRVSPKHIAGVVEEQAGEAGERKVG
jgi:hypothetical protein